MVDESTGWERVVASMRGPLRQYLDLLRELGGTHTQAVTLFGAIAGNTFDPTRHTARSVWVLDQVDLAILGRLAPHGPGLGKAGIAAPLTMTPAYIRASLDTFPLEFIEIQQRHITVFGEDFFSGLSFEPAHVRLQCEREFKTILIGLRQGLLAAAGSDKFLDALQRDVGDSLARTMRGLLWLQGEREAKPLSAVREAIEKIASRKLAGLQRVLEEDGPYGWEALEGLYRDVEALGTIVNDW